MIDVDQQVAVVAMSCRFPGAPDPAAYWDLVRSGRDGLTRLDEEQLRAAGVPVGLLRRPGYVPVSGLLDDPGAVDAAALGLTEAEARLMDPQQRLFLECTVEALESAGLAGGETHGAVGVYAGQSLPAYLLDNLGHRFHPRGGADPVESLHLHGLNVADYLPQRVAWLLGTTGPAVAIGATCATSLVAVHTAVGALLGHECDVAVAGGVTLRLPQEEGYVAVPDGPFATDGVTRSYTAGATGTVFTQGAGVVVLRRLSDAIADGDEVLAVVLGTAVGNDGRERVGFTAPSVSGQARVIADALDVADVTPREVGLVEGHGTGTALGDPIEVAALNQVFGAGEEPWCALGSVKAQIGHTDSAAGVAGFIKAVLAIQHGEIPPTRHAERPHPDLPLEGSPFHLPVEARPWPGARIAGVSAFGIGGVNAHAVLGQAPPTSAPAASAPVGEPVLLVQAADEQALHARTEQLTTLARRLDLSRRADLSGTLARGVRPHAWRTAVVHGRPSLPPSQAGPRSVILGFPGGGAQFAGMARSLHRDEPVFAAALDRVCERLLARSGHDPRDIALDPAAAAHHPGTGLPALFAVEAAMAETLAAYAVEARVVLGHSVGEYAAALVAGVLEEGEACRLVAERSRLMATLPPGAMVSVRRSADEVRPWLTHREVDVAASNGPDSCVLAGRREHVEQLKGELVAAGIEVRTVGVDVAAHSRQVEPIMPAMAAAVAGFAARPPRTVLVTTTDGAVVEGAVDPRHWVDHLRATVRFDEALATARDHAAAAPVLVQPGPSSSVLSAAAAQGIAERIPLCVEPDEADREGAGVEALRAGLGRLWSLGVPVDTDRLAPRRRVVPVPAYPWQRRELMEPHRLRPDGRLAGSTTSTGGPEPSAEEPLQRPTWSTAAPVAGPALRGRRVCVLGPVEHTSGVAALLTRAGADLVDDHPEAVLVVGHPDLAEELAQWQGLARNLQAEGASPVVLQLTYAAEQVTGDDPVDPVATAATGLPRVLSQEVAGVRWRTLDLLPGTDPDVVVPELGDLLGDESAGGEHLALRGRRRWQRSWAAWQPSTEGQRPDGWWLVTGGFGQVGLALAERLVAAGVPPTAVVLAGRTLPDGDDPRSHRWQELAGLGVQGHAVDVTDRAGLTAVLAEHVGEQGPAAVVVHAPVDVDLAALAELDEASIAAALGPKVVGAESLRAALAATTPEGSQPPRVLLMSSAAGTIGGFGLGAYVAASRYLDGLAHREGWLAVDWDRIRVGTEEEAAAASEISMRHAIDLEVVLDQLLALASGVADPLGAGHLAASPAELNSRSRRLDVTRRVSGGSSTSAGGLSRAEGLVAEVWSGVLGRPVTSPDDDFFALGGHSLLATRVLAVLRDEHGADLRLRDLLSAPTVAGCATLLEAAGSSTGVATTQVSPAAAPPEPTGLTTGFGLTRVQHAYWLGRTQSLDPSRSASGDGVGCHFFLEYAAEDLDLDRYEASWRAVIARHPMLRTVIREGRHELLDPEFVLPVRDLTARGAGEAEEMLTALRERLSTRVASPDRWPLIHPEVVLLPGGEARVLLSVDVLVCDSASWMIVDREIARLYQDPDAELEPLTVTFGDCMQALDARAAGPEHAAAEQYWRERVPTLPGAPVIADRESGEPPRFTRLAAELPVEVWGRLARQAADRRLTPTAVVLTAYVDVLRRWSGQDHLGVTLTVFDRPELPGVDDVVGEFSSLLLHESGPQHAESWWDRVASTQARMVDDLDHRAFTGPEVLTLWSRERGRTSNVPVVFTSMLGLDRWSGQEAHRHDWLGRYVGGVSQTPQVWLDHQAFENGGALVLQWDVCETVVSLDLAQQHFEDYVALLTRAADGGADAPDSADPAAPGGEPSADLRGTLTSIWCDLLHLEADEIGGHSFLALGGDSLLAVRMAAEVRRRCEVVLPLAEVRADLTLAELAELVSRLRAGAGAEVTLRRRSDPSEPFGLLPLQQAYFVGQSGGWEISYDTVHVSTDVALRGVQEAGLLQKVQRAADKVARRHPMLRVEILDDGTQRFRDADDPHWRTPVEVHDLRDHPDPDSRLAELRGHWATQGPDPRSGPGVRIDVVLLGDGHGRLHVSSSLLVMDGWSAALYDRELITCLTDPNAVLPPLWLDFGDYVTTLAGPEAERQAEQDLAWWAERIDDLPASPALPRAALPMEHGTTAVADTMTMRERRVDAAGWDALREQCAERGLTPATVVLTAYAVALAEVTGRPELLLNSLQHNRLAVHEDVEAVIGAFSRTALVPVELVEGPFAEVARQVARVQQEYAAHHRVSAVEVGRVIGRRLGLSRSVAPVVFQSTLGMDAAVGGDLGDAGPLGRIDVRDFHQDLRTPQVELELRAFDLAGELVLSLGSVDALFVDGLADHVLDRVHERLLDPAGLDDTVVLDPRAAWETPWETTVSTDAHLRTPTLTPGTAVSRDVPAEVAEAVHRVWESTVGVDGSSGDDFFASGGDSLAAVRMLVALRRESGVDVALRDFLAAPTLGGLMAAAALAQGVGTGSGAGAELTAVDRVTRGVVELRAGRGRPIFLLHPSGGDVLCYVDLARLLRVDRPVLAISDPALEDGRTFPDIATMAEAYRSVVTALQPEGPWTLGGWSMGGTVAHEVAGRMAAAGQEVDRLVLIDSNSPEVIVAKAGLSPDEGREQQLLRQLRSIEAFLGLDLGTHEDWESLAEALQAAGAVADVSALTDRTPVFAAHLDALSRHTATVLPDGVRTLLLRADQTSPRNSGEGMGVDDITDDALGWRPWVEGPLEVRSVDAHHYSIVQRPAVDVVAGEMGRVLG